MRNNESNSVCSKSKRDVPASRARELVRTSRKDIPPEHFFPKFHFAQKPMTTASALELTVWEVRGMYSSLAKVWSEDSSQCYVEDLLRVSEEKYPSQFGEFSTFLGQVVSKTCVFLCRACVAGCYI